MAQRFLDEKAAGFQVAQVSLPANQTKVAPANMRESPPNCMLRRAQSLLFG